MSEALEFPRRAPYAPISALREFLEKMRHRSVPARVDRKFLQELNVASNNEWALLSALKFLGIVDEHGVPTHAYRRLQSTDAFAGTLRHLVETAYQRVFEAGGLAMSPEDLENFFRIASSPSQAKNAARFFREVVRLAGVGAEQQPETSRLPAVAPAATPPTRSAEPEPGPAPARDLDDVLAAKVALLNKLPAPREEWSATEYQAIVDRFLEMLKILDQSTGK